MCCILCRPLVCLNCHKEVSQPVQRMKMEVAVRCDTDPTVIVNISVSHCRGHVCIVKIWAPSFVGFISQTIQLGSWNCEVTDLSLSFSSAF